MLSFGMAEPTVDGMAEPTVDVVEYENDAGKNAFAVWLAKLDTRAFARVTTSIARMRHGNFGDVKSVGKGVSATRINSGPGYRIYFGNDGNKLVILLGGGTKKRQSRDVQSAQAAWGEYKKNKKRKTNSGTN